MLVNVNGTKVEISKSVVNDEPIVKAHFTVYKAVITFYNTESKNVFTETYTKFSKDELKEQIDYIKKSCIKSTKIVDIEKSKDEIIKDLYMFIDFSIALNREKDNLIEEL